MLGKAAYALGGSEIVETRNKHQRSRRNDLAARDSLAGTPVDDCLDSRDQGASRLVGANVRREQCQRVIVQQIEIANVTQVSVDELNHFLALELN